jgi:hypothetical protein
MTKHIALASVAQGLREVHGLRAAVIAIAVAANAMLDGLDKLENEMMRLERVVGGDQ